MISKEAQIKLAIVSIKIVGQWVPLETISEDLRDSFGVHLTPKQIAAIYRYWRECNKKLTFTEKNEGSFGIEKKKIFKSEKGYGRVCSLYKTDAKTIKRLLDYLYECHLLNKNRSGI